MKTLNRLLTYIINIQQSIIPWTDLELPALIRSLIPKLD